MTRKPLPDRPYMPGYGIRPAGEGTGLLPWSWAEERLEKSHDYWIATVWPDGRPHVMPVWGMWRDGELWFSSSLGSRKTRNLLANPVCVVTSDDPQNPVIFEGTATLEQDVDVLAKILAAENEKYGTDYGMDMFDPAVNATFRIKPRWAFALTEGDFTGSPTKWEF